MQPDLKYDIVIIGAGIAGLSFAIQAAKAGYSVAVFEKEKSPLQKVCGGFVSNESWNFLQELGVPLSEWNVPVTHHLEITTLKGNSYDFFLPLGGFGIDRTLLELQMKNIGKEAGVIFFENCRVLNVLYRHQKMLVFTDKGETEAAVVIGAYGNYTRLDSKWKRTFALKKPNRLNHFVGVSYQIKALLNEEKLSYHQFKHGFCTITPLGEHLYTLSYITHASFFKKMKLDIQELETQVLRKNSHISNIFQSAIFLNEAPLSISRISFNKKSQIEQHILMIGDAAGSIPPIAGNGISMALHSSHIAFEQVNDFLKGKINRFEMELQYTQIWEKKFGKNMWLGRIFQSLLSLSFSDKIIGWMAKYMHSILSKLIRKTEGQPF